MLIKFAKSHFELFILDSHVYSFATICSFTEGSFVFLNYCVCLDAEDERPSLLYPEIVARFLAADSLTNNSFTHHSSSPVHKKQTQRGPSFCLFWLNISIVKGEKFYLPLQCYLKFQMTQGSAQFWQNSLYSLWV